MSQTAADDIRPCVLVVEDDEKVAGAIGEGLGRNGYVVQRAATGDEGLRMALQGALDAIVLDLMLPGCDGLEILDALRRRGDWTPVLILTARDDLSDRLRGLDGGADDYLVKPFAFPELLARLRAIVRRGVATNDTRFGLADLVVDAVTRRAVRGRRELRLTPREFDLLLYLLRHAGTVVSREMLARDVWQEANRGTSLDNVIDVHLVRLRRKVDQDAAVRLIHTVRGLGFVLQEAPA